MNLQYESLGKILYNKMKAKSSSKVCMIDINNREEITYGKLLKSSIILANKLKKIGVKKGTVITIVSRNSWKYTLTVISCLYIGAQISLFNPDYTPNELEYFLLICQPSFLFCSQKFLNGILKMKDKILFPKNIVIYENGDHNLISFNNLLESNESDINFSPTETDPEDTTLILTSSGSTGFPKCVQLSARNVNNLILIHNNPDMFGVNENEITIAYLPFFHIYGVIITLSSVLFGTKMVILENFVPDTFLKIIENYKITKLCTVPSILAFLTKTKLIHEYDLTSIKDISRGAICSKNLAKSIQNKFGISIRQAYGMTEVGVVTMVPKNSPKIDSVGKIIGTNEIKVYDINSSKELLHNQIGELRIKADGVMKGYLGNKEATEAIFDENGFVKSGDLGYYDEDGFFYVIDRIKEIIKYKGFQVAHAELENLLLQHPGVKEVTVVGKPDVNVGELATALIVKEPNKSVTAKEIIKHVEENISVQKRLYRGVKFLDEIPKTSTGKISRKKLKELIKLITISHKL